MIPQLDFDPSMNNAQGFAFGDFVESVGDTLQSGVDNFKANLDANAINSLAIANLNKAQADAIKRNAENRRQITRSIFIVLIVSIIAITVVALAKKFWK